jgi:twitching motility protein PilU
MSSMEQEPEVFIHGLLARMCDAGGSDLFISNDFPPSMKVDGEMQPMSDQNLTGEAARKLAYAMMNENQREEFARELECNFAMTSPAGARFRVSVFMHLQHVGMVIRPIPSIIPTIEELGLPEIFKEIIMYRRGLVLVVGSAGSGKSTTQAAMIGYRNHSTKGHIITVEDPIEFVHKSDLSLISQREVGIDTHGWHIALRNTLRQAPDVILIGEIRDTETMEHAIAFADTGHLCVGTLHANNASQTMDRVINFFPEQRRPQLLMDLSVNLRAIISQRLIRTVDGKGRKAAIEIMLNTPAIADRIFDGQFHEIRALMAESYELGMRTFDGALFDLFEGGYISYEDALRNADSANELRLNIKLKSKRNRIESPFD